MTFARTIQQLGRDQVETESISCKDRTSIWMKGLTISNFMRSVKFNGLTGPVEFDNDGARRNIRADVLELKPAGFEKIGNWQWDRTFQAKDRLEITRKFEMTTEKKTLVVIMSLVSFELLTGIISPISMTTHYYRLIHTQCSKIQPSSYLAMIDMRATASI